MGARPIPGGDVFWVSPDIWLTGGDANGNPIGGQPATLFARIWNLGSLAAAPVRVDFSFIVFPATGILPSAPQLIGTGWGSVPALSAQVIQCPVPWDPPVGTQDIHSCLIVTCSAPLQGDTPTMPGSPVADRHVGQHNYTVLEGTAGQQFRFSLRLANLGPVPAAVDLLGAAAWHTTAALHGDAFVFPPSLSGALSGAADYATASNNQLWARRAALLDERSSRLRLRPLPATQVTDAIAVTRVERRGVVHSNPLVEPPNRIAAGLSEFTPLDHSVQLDPQQEALAHLTLTVPADAAHPWFIAHISQATAQALTGGYTIACHVSR